MNCKLAIAVGCVLSAAGVLPTAQQPERTRTEALARRATARLQALEHEADRLAAEEKTLLGELRKLDVERQIKTEQLRQIESEALQVTTDLAATTDRVRMLEERNQLERPGLAARLVEIYKLGRGRYIRLLLSTGDLRRIGEATRTVATLAELDRRRIAEHQRTLGDLSVSRARLESRRQQLERLRAEGQRARASVERAAQAKNALIQDIDRRRDLNAELFGELESARQKLQASLRGLATGAGATGASGAGTAGAEPVALPLRPFRGDLPWPVAGLLRRPFGAATGLHGAPSNGIEITAPEGTRVAAIHEGVVAFADAFAGFGNLVILDHGSQAFSLYGNLLDFAVARGGRVDRGQVIGSVGSPAVGPTGLYFELRIDDRPVDPLQWLRRRQVGTEGPKS